MPPPQPTIRQQLRDAFERERLTSGLTLDALIERAKLGISRPSMWRLLYGEQPLKDDVIEALARALKEQITTGPARDGAP